MTNTTVANYIAAWNEGDTERRRELVAQVWTEDGTYLDPLMAGAGTEQLTAMIGAAQAQFSGHRFELSVAPDAHNDVVRFTWTLTGPNGAAAVGQDFATLAEDGRFKTVTGFLEAA
jgi:SnoaL-like domain